MEDSVETQGGITVLVALAGLGVLALLTLGCLAVMVLQVMVR